MTVKRQPLCTRPKRRRIHTLQNANKKYIYFCEDNSDYNDNDKAVDEVISRQGMYVPDPLKGCVLRLEFPTRRECNPCSYLLLDNVNYDVKRKDLQHCSQELDISSCLDQLSPKSPNSFI